MVIHTRAIVSASLQVNTGLGWFNHSNSNVCRDLLHKEHKQTGRRIEECLNWQNWNTVRWKAIQEMPDTHWSQITHNAYSSTATGAGTYMAKISSLQRPNTVGVQMNHLKGHHTHTDTHTPSAKVESTMINAIIILTCMNSKRQHVIKL